MDDGVLLSAAACSVGPGRVLVSGRTKSERQCSASKFAGASNSRSPAVDHVRGFARWALDRLGHLAGARRIGGAGAQNDQTPEVRGTAASRTLSAPDAPSWRSQPG